MVEIHFDKMKFRRMQEKYATATWNLRTISVFAWRHRKITENYVWFQISALTWIRSALFFGVTQRRVAIPYRRFGTTYRPSSGVKKSSSTSWSLKKGAIFCPETSVQNYRCTLR